MYFITIVYQVALRLVEKSTQIKKIYWALIHGIFLIYICANIAVLVLRLTDLYATQLCNCNWIIILKRCGYLCYKLLVLACRFVWFSEVLSMKKLKRKRFQVDCLLSKDFTRKNILKIQCQACGNGLLLIFFAKYLDWVRVYTYNFLLKRIVLLVQ